MQTISLIVATVGLSLVASFSAAQQLTCAPDANERGAMKEAPGGARRIDAHTLEVTYKKGARRFTDKPPHDELGGLHWLYCGYDAKAQSHLIQRQLEGLFSGQLLREDNGRVVAAGHTVIFSADRQTFLAIEQENGQDGEQWSVYGEDGKRLWHGYAGTLKQVKGVPNIVSQFEQPRWDVEGNLTAQNVCNYPYEGKNAIVLIQSEKVWRWRDSANCTPQKVTP